MNIIDELQARMPKFSKRQRHVAEYICGSCDRAAFMTAGALAEAAGVSESTVVRFAADLGFDGYTEFRAAMQENLRERLSTAARHGEQDERAKVLRDCVAKDTARLNALLSEKNINNFDYAAAIIAKAERVFIHGGGFAASSAAALEGWLGLIKPRVVALGDVVTARLRLGAVDIGTGDVLIVFASTPSADFAVELIEYAASCGAATIAVAERECLMDLPLSAGIDVDCGGIPPMHTAMLCTANALALAADRLLGSPFEKFFSDAEN